MPDYPFERTVCWTGPRPSRAVAGPARGPAVDEAVDEAIDEAGAAHGDVFVLEPRWHLAPAADA
ncbi:hypothetical protein, partial [Burkholderia thailandensis]|uniref:hypothetical protein n=1 Tax=Burkholderia thailandensis TaxID=57975 RepID=UPI001E4B9EB4